MSGHSYFSRTSRTRSDLRPRTTPNGNKTAPRPTGPTMSADTPGSSLPSLTPPLTQAAKKIQGKTGNPRIQEKKTKNNKTREMTPLKNGTTQQQQWPPPEMRRLATTLLPTQVIPRKPRTNQDITLLSPKSPHSHPPPHTTHKCPPPRSPLGELGASPPRATLGTIGPMNPTSHHQLNLSFTSVQFSI